MNYKWLRLHFLTFFILVPAALFDQVNCEQCTDVLFTDPQIPLFSHFFIKNGSHNTIYTFKNYFATVFSVFSFSKINYIQTDPNCWSLSINRGSFYKKRHCEQIENFLRWLFVTPKIFLKQFLNIKVFKGIFSWLWRWAQWSVRLTPN